MRKLRNTVHAHRRSPHSNSAIFSSLTRPEVLATTALSESSQHPPPTPVNMCNFTKNYYIYTSCIDPGVHFLRTWLEGDSKRNCALGPHERYILIPGCCPLCDHHAENPIKDNACSHYADVIPYELPRERRPEDHPNISRKPLAKDDEDTRVFPPPDASQPGCPSTAERPEIHPRMLAPDSRSAERLGGPGAKVANSEISDEESESSHMTDTESCSTESRYSSGKSVTGLVQPAIQSGADIVTRNVMTEFDRLFEDFLRAFVRRYANFPEFSGQSGGLGGNEVVGQTEAFNNCSLKRRRGRDSNEGEEDDNARKPNRAPGVPEAGKDLEAHRRLACPFRKHDPSTYNIRTHRKCVEGRWPTTHRIKYALPL